MRDEERIELYYKCNTLDWKSEEVLAQKSRAKVAEREAAYREKLYSVFHWLSVFFGRLADLARSSKIG